MYFTQRPSQMHVTYSCSHRATAAPLHGSRLQRINTQPRRQTSAAIMSWMQGGKKPGPDASDDKPGPGKSALPPACPRCELMKGQVRHKQRISHWGKHAARACKFLLTCSCRDAMQFTKTIQNYQKAYRKKVEGLKTELKTSRTANTRLTKQVKQLKSITRLHLPSLVLGAAVAVLSTSVLRLLRRRNGSPAGGLDSDSKEAAPPVAPGTPPTADDEPAPQERSHGDVTAA